MFRGPRPQPRIQRGRPGLVMELQVRGARIAGSSVPCRSQMRLFLFLQKQTLQVALFVGDSNPYLGACFICSVEPPALGLSGSWWGSDP